MNHNRFSPDLHHLLVKTLTNGITSDTDLSPVRSFLEQNGIESDHDDAEELLWKSIVTYFTLEKGSRRFDLLRPIKSSPAPSESSSFCPYPAALKIMALISTNQQDLFREALLLLNAHQLHLHPAAIPPALTYCQKKYTLWKHLIRVCGERADWLAAKNPQFSWYFSAKNKSIDQDNPQGLNLRELFLWLRSQQQEEYVAVFDRLSSAQQKKMFDHIRHHLYPSDEAICRKWLKGRSSDMKKKAYLALLTLDTRESKDTLDFLLPAINNHIQISQGMISINVPELLNELHPHLDQSPLTVDEELLPKILSIVAVESLIPDKLEHHEACRQLLTKPTLLLLALGITESVIVHRSETWIKALGTFWQKHYPLLSTSQIPARRLYGAADSDFFISTISEILKDPDDYWIEKLAIVTSDNKHYLSRKLSDMLAELLLFHVQQGLNRTDIKLLKDLLPVVAKRMDPRASLALRKLWPDQGMYYSKLNKDMVRFRKILENRYELFSYIAGLK